MKKNPFPDEGELVVGTVKEVKGFGAFVTLDEYTGKEGFIHIAEVASGWVKYVRDHVRENQKVVCKVVSVDVNRGHVDLSLKRVNDHQRRDKIAEWKNEQKADKLFEILATRLGKTVPEVLEEFGWKLVESYGNAYAAFETGAIGEEALTDDGFQGAWVKPFVELARENVSVPYVEIRGHIEVSSFAPDGVEKIKKALLKAKDTEYEDVTITVQYMGAPKYRVIVKAPDYKVAEEELKAAAERVIATIKKSGGDGSFERAAEA